MSGMFKPWKIPVEMRGYNENTVAKLKLVNPDDQIGIIDQSIKLTKKSYAIFGKILAKDILNYPDNAEFRHVSSAMRRAAEFSIMKIIDKHPEFSATWRTPTQDCLYSHGYRIRRLKIMGVKPIDELKGMATTYQAFLNNTILIQPRNILVGEKDPFNIYIRALGDLKIMNHVLLPADWNMNNLRIVRVYNYEDNSASYELRCNQFLSSKALITAPKLVKSVCFTNYDGTYTGGR